MSCIHGHGNLLDQCPLCDSEPGFEEEAMRRYFENRIALGKLAALGLLLLVLASSVAMLSRCAL